MVEAASSPSVAYFGSIGLLSIDVERNAEGDFEVVGHDACQVSTADVARANDKIDALTAALVEENAKVLDQVIGTSSRAYEYAPSSAEAPGGWELVRTEDTPIGHVVTSAFLAQTGADLAFENAGGIRGGIPAGDVTAGESSARARHMRGGVARAYRTGWLGADDGEPVGFGDVCDRRGLRATPARIRQAARRMRAQTPPRGRLPCPATGNAAASAAAVLLACAAVSSLAAAAAASRRARRERWRDAS